MTDSNGDLVRRVREAIAHNGDAVGHNSPTTDQQARAAIAAVLDDLEAEVRADADKDLHKWAPKLAEQRHAFDLALLGWIEWRRRELGLAEPVEPCQRVLSEDGQNPTQDNQGHSGGVKTDDRA